MELLTRTPPVYRNLSNDPEFFMSSIKECGNSNETNLSIRNLFVGMQNVRMLPSNTLHDGVLLSQTIATLDNQDIALLAFSKNATNCQFDLVFWRFFDDQSDLDSFFERARSFESFARNAIFPTSNQ
jgi:hypothetical protein